MSNSLFYNSVNDNFLSPTGSRFWIRKSPMMNFFCQQSAIPGVSMAPAVSSNPFVEIPYPGEHLLYDELPITFKVDEDLANYLEIHDWLRSLGKPEDFGEYSRLADLPQYTGLGIKSDALLLILDSKKNPNFQVIFKDTFPISLSKLEFTHTSADVEYVTATAQFRYTDFEILSVKVGDADNFVPAWPEAEGAPSRQGTGFYSVPSAVDISS